MARKKKASEDNKAVSKLFIIFFPCSCLALLMPVAAPFFLPPLYLFFFFSLSPVYLVFSTVSLIQSFLNLVFLSTGAGTGQGQENDNIRSFSGQIRGAATCADTNTPR